MMNPDTIASGAPTRAVDSPMLSIIMPVYNMERYLAESVDSVLSQTFRDWELILIDDGSTDSSGAMCDRYAAHDSRVKVIHQANSGQGKARNSALAIARGKYVGFVDSDDWIDPDMFGPMVEALERENADMALCGYYLDFIGRSKVKAPMPAPGVYDGASLMKEGYLDSKVQSLAWDKVFRREIVEGGFSGQRFFEDHAVMLGWLSKVSRWVAIPEPKYHYRMRKSGVTNGFSIEKRMAKFYADIERARFMSGMPVEKHGLTEGEIAFPVITSAVGTAKAIARNVADRSKVAGVIKEIVSLSESYFDVSAGSLPPKVERRYRLMTAQPEVFRRRMRISKLFAFSSKKKERAMYE